MAEKLHNTLSYISYDDIKFYYINLLQLEYYSILVVVHFSNSAGIKFFLNNVILMYYGEIAEPTWYFQQIYRIAE